MYVIYNICILYSLKWKYFPRVRFENKKDILKTIAWIHIISKKAFIYISKVGDLSRGWPKGSLFSSFHTEV